MVVVLVPGSAFLLYVGYVRTPFGSIFFGITLLGTVIGTTLWLMFGEIDDGLEGMWLFVGPWFVASVGVLIDQAFAGFIYGPEAVNEPGMRSFFLAARRRRERRRTKSP